MQPSFDETTSPKVPGPSNSNVNRMSFAPLPFSNTCTGKTPDKPPEVVNCKINTRPFSSGKPLGVPFKTNHAPPVLVLITMFCPSMADPEANAGTKGCSASSTVLTATWSPTFWLSRPMVIQLSAPMVGKKAMNAGLMPVATEAPIGSL